MSNDNSTAPEVNVYPDRPYCRREAHRYKNIVFTYTDEDGIIRNVIAEDASTTGAKFVKPSWGDLNKIKEFTFNVNGTAIKTTNIKKYEAKIENPMKDNGKCIIQYNCDQLLNFAFPKVLSKIETLYSDLLEDIKNRKIMIPTNKSRVLVLSFLGIIIVGLLASPILFAASLQITDSVWKLGIFIGSAVVLSIVLCVYAVMSQKDLQEYVKNDRRLVMVNYLEQVMIVLSLLKSKNEEKAIEKLQKAGETLLESTLR